MSNYIIVPDCSDLNRGDQALVWETKRIAEDAGFKGKFFLQSELNEPVKQSENKDITIISPLLEHPSRKFGSNNNIKYSAALKISWGVVAIFDFLESLLLLFSLTRPLIKKLLSTRKQKSLEIFMNADAIFMKGGGLLQTYGGVSSTYSMYFWTFPLILAGRLKKPVYVMPNSFGPFEGPFVKHIAHFALKNCRVVYARESISADKLETDVNVKPIKRPDLAFYLEPSKLDRESIYKRFDLPTNRKLVAMTMRPYRFPKSSNSEKAYEDFKNSLSGFIEWLYDEGFMAVIVVHTLAINAHENDLACITDVVSNLNEEKYRIVSDSKYDCQDLKYIYGLTDYIVGTRFHSVIFSFGMKVPGLAIAYTGNKSQGIMHDMGLDEYVLDIYSVTKDVLVSKFLQVIDNEQHVLNTIDAYLENSAHERSLMIDELSNR